LTPDEVVKVLARVQMDDNRQVDRVVVQAWIQEIGHLDFEDALEAVVMHRKSTPAWLMAAHICENVRLIRARRARDERVNNPRQIEPNHITLDRAAHEAETQYWIEFYRRERAEQKEQQ
jgi:hypothetical protein